MKEKVPGGEEKIVFDRFHIMGHAGKAVDRVRIGERKRLASEGDEVLKRTKYLWLYSEENLLEKHRERFRSAILAAARAVRSCS